MTYLLLVVISGPLPQIEMTMSGDTGNGQRYTGVYCRILPLGAVHGCDERCATRHYTGSLIQTGNQK